MNRLQDLNQNLPSVITDSLSSSVTKQVLEAAKLGESPTPLTANTSEELQKLTANALSSALISPLPFRIKEIIGTPNSDFLRGTYFADRIFGLAGDDVILGLGGNDYLFGGKGFDTADYSSLGQAVTLKPNGVIDKGKAGTDKLFQVESIIGAVDQANAIDASTAGGKTSIEVDLSANSLVVKNIPGFICC